MKTKLITSLRAAASALEQGRFHYNWHEASRCNCGVLVCALLGLTPGQLSPRIPIGAKEQATWRQRMAAQCPITGQTHHELLKTLFGFGLTQEDMINLEFLRDPNVISRIPRKRVWYKLWLKRRPLYYTEMRDVVLYMRAWADLLQEQGAMDTATYELLHDQSLSPTTGPQ